MFLDSGGSVSHEEIYPDRSIVNLYHNQTILLLWGSKRTAWLKYRKNVIQSPYFTKWVVSQNLHFSSFLKVSENTYVSICIAASTLFIVLFSPSLSHCDTCNVFPSSMDLCMDSDNTTTEVMQELLEISVVTYLHDISSKLQIQYKKCTILVLYKKSVNSQIQTNFDLQVIQIFYTLYFFIEYRSRCSFKSSALLPNKGFCKAYQPNLAELLTSYNKT